MRILPFAIACATFSLAACSGSGHKSSDNGNNLQNPPAATLRGSAYQGAISAGKVVAYSLNASGKNDQVIGSTKTGADGSFELNVSTLPAHGMRIEVTEGTYQSEADTSKTVSGSALSVILQNVTKDGVTGLVINPLTTFVDRRWQTLLVSGAASVDGADSEIKSIYGLKNETASLSSINPDFSASNGSAASIALLLGALEQLAIESGKSPISIIEAFSQDLSDGRIDGKSSAGTPITYGEGEKAPITLASNQFLSALSSYIDPANTKTLTHEKGVTIDAQIITDMRAGVISVADKSTGLDVSSSGAITSLTLLNNTGETQQNIYFAAQTAGLKVIDFTDPANPVVLNTDALSKAVLEGTKPLLPEVNGVISVPSTAGNPQLLLYAYDSKNLVMVDALNLTVTATLELPIAKTTSFSGASGIYVYGGIPDTIAAQPTVWLTTGAGYLPVYTVGHTLTAGTPVPMTTIAGMPENTGASVTDRMIFAPGYGGGSAGVSILDLESSNLFSLKNDIFESVFKMEEPDAGAVDTGLKVGVFVEEHSNELGLMNLQGLRDSNAYSLNPTEQTFMANDPANQFKLQKLDYSASFSGVTVDSKSHLAFFIEEFGDALGVGKIDDPAHPADSAAGWQGLVDYRYEDNASAAAGTGKRFCAAGDPHSQATITHVVNGRAYGFALNTCDAAPANKGGALIVDLANFLAAPGEASHALTNNPFNDANIIKMVSF